VNYVSVNSILKRLLLYFIYIYKFIGSILFKTDPFNFWRQTISSRDFPYAVNLCY